MEEQSKDAEVRARVTGSMFDQLTKIAEDRHEQLPVILREALLEYLARRSATGHTKYPLPGAEALMEILRDQPEVAKTLIALGRVLSPPSSGRGDQAARNIVSAAAAPAPVATNKRRTQGSGVSYKDRRRTKNRPTV